MEVKIEVMLILFLLNDEIVIETFTHNIPLIKNLSDFGKSKMSKKDEP